MQKYHQLVHFGNLYSSQDPNPLASPSGQWNVLCSLMITGIAKDLNSGLFFWWLFVSEIQKSSHKPPRNDHWKGCETINHHPFRWTGIDICFLALTTNIKISTKGWQNSFRTGPVDLMQAFDKKVCTEIAMIWKTSKDASSHPAIPYNVYMQCTKICRPLTIFPINGRVSSAKSSSQQQWKFLQTRGNHETWPHHWGDIPKFSFKKNGDSSDVFFHSNRHLRTIHDFENHNGHSIVDHRFLGLMAEVEVSRLENRIVVLNWGVNMSTSQHPLCQKTLDKICTYTYTHWYTCKYIGPRQCPSNLCHSIREFIVSKKKIPSFSFPKLSSS